MAISTNLNYPKDYLPCPLKENFGLKATSPLKSTDGYRQAATKASLYFGSYSNASFMDLY
jgi:hypothetical protein